LSLRKNTKGRGRADHQEPFLVPISPMSLILKCPCHSRPPHHCCESRRDAEGGPYSCGRVLGRSGHRECRSVVEGRRWPPSGPTRYQRIAGGSGIVFRRRSNSRWRPEKRISINSHFAPCPQVESILKPRHVFFPTRFGE